MSENEKYINNLINSWEKEITPVHEFSDGVKLLKIKYTEKETKIMDIFRAILLSKEISLRVYEFTSIVIEFFSTNYAAWVLRRQCIDKIKEIELTKELNWLDEMMLLNQKNYQIWHHRKLLIDKMNDASNEKKLLDQVFSSQPKNFHAWTHRIWMIRRFDNVEGEFDFIEKMLKDDVKNNSVWNYRFFLVLYINGNKLEKNIIENEIKYAIEKIKECPVNECPYSYIRGFITKYNYKYDDFLFVKDEVENLINNNKEDNPYGLNILLDFYEEEKNGEKFNEIIEKLKKVDYIRKKYYGWRKENSIFKENKKDENKVENKEDNKDDNKDDNKENNKDDINNEKECQI